MDECEYCKSAFREKALFVGGGWFVVHDPHPAKDKEGKSPAFQLLFASVVHGDDTRSLLASDWGAIMLLLRLCREKFGISGGCLCVPDGDSTLSGRTVRHPQVRYYVPRMVKDVTLTAGFRIVPIDIPTG